MAVGQKHGGDVGEVPPDPGQKPLQAPAREPGINKEPPATGLQIGCIARAAARKDAKPQNNLQTSVLLIISGNSWLPLIEDLSTTLAGCLPAALSQICEGLIGDQVDFSTSSSRTTRRSAKSGRYKFGA